LHVTIMLFSISNWHMYFLAASTPFSASNNLAPCSATSSHSSYCPSSGTVSCRSNTWSTLRTLQTSSTLSHVVQSSNCTPRVCKLCQSSSSSSLSCTVIITAADMMNWGTTLHKPVLDCGGCYGSPCLWDEVHSSFICAAFRSSPSSSAATVFWMNCSV
jgi:hypothetical protein